MRLVDNCCTECGKSGITFAVFRFVGKIPVENDKLAKRAIGSPKDSKIVLRIWFGRSCELDVF